MNTGSKNYYVFRVGYLELFWTFKWLSFVFQSEACLLTVKSFLYCLKNRLAIYVRLIFTYSSGVMHFSRPIHFRECLSRYFRRIFDTRRISRHFRGIFRPKRSEAEGWKIRKKCRTLSNTFEHSIHFLKKPM